MVVVLLLCVGDGKESWNHTAVEKINVWARFALRAWGLFHPGHHEKGELSLRCAFPQLPDRHIINPWQYQTTE
jgi:hypothetical protein